jgi:hypothetical protein
MAVQKWTLTDVAAGTYVQELNLSSDQLGGSLEGCEISKRTLRGGLCDGVDVIRVNNGRLTVDVLPTRGMGLWKAWLEGEEIGWQSPVRGPVHPKFVPLMEPSGLGWLDGFDELLVRCGLESNGAPDFDDNGKLRYPVHGRIGNRPAHLVEVALDDDRGEIAVTGVVEETRFHFTKLRLTSKVIVKVGGASLRVSDEVENFSGSPAEMQMLYHINFGPPLLDPGSRFLAPVKTVMPRDARAAEGIGTWNLYAEERAGYAEEVYFLDLLAGSDGGTRTLLKNAAQNRGVSVVVNKSQLPYYTLWKNTITSSDGYATGLEPGTNFPNPRTFEGDRGRTVKLGPGGKVTFSLGLEVHRGSEEVAAAEQAIIALQAGTEPAVFASPQADWCVV